MRSLFLPSISCNSASKWKGNRTGLYFANFVDTYDDLRWFSDSIRKSNKLSTMAATMRLVEPYLGIKRSPRAIRRWIKDGAAYCILAASGAFLYVRWEIIYSYYTRLHILAGNFSLCSGEIDYQHIINMPDNPDWFFASLSTIKWVLWLSFLYSFIYKSIDGKEGRLIAEFVIPAVNKLRLKYSFKFTNMFSYTLLTDYGQPVYILSDNVVESDQFFDCIAFKYGVSFF